MSKLENYVHSIFAAAGAISLTYYGFEVKTAKQLNLPVPKWEATRVLKGGAFAAPKIGLIVGTQMGAQELFEKLFMKKDSKPTTSSMVGSSALVGAVSSPFLAAFNGQTMGLRFLEAIKAIELRQTTAIALREVFFLLSLRISTPLTGWMQRRFGDHQTVQAASSFSAGFFGSLCGHPFDTAFTLWQRQMKILSPRQLAQGALVKAITTGIFVMLYRQFNKQ